MNQQVRTILDSNFLGVLSTVNADGSPWATPLHVVADDEALYWFSNPDREHSVNLERDNRASLAVFSPDLSKGPQGVYVNGTAELLADEAREGAVEAFASRLGTLPDVFVKAAAYKLTLGELNEQKSTGNCWYFYSPK